MLPLEPQTSHKYYSVHTIYEGLGQGPAGIYGQADRIGPQILHCLRGGVSRRRHMPLISPRDSIQNWARLAISYHNLRLPIFSRPLFDRHNSLLRLASPHFSIDDVCDTKREFPVSTCGAGVSSTSIRFLMFPTWLPSYNGVAT